MIVVVYMAMEMVRVKVSMRVVVDSVTAMVRGRLVGGRQSKGDGQGRCSDHSQGRCS